MKFLELVWSVPYSAGCWIEWISLNKMFPLFIPHTWLYSTHDFKICILTVIVFHKWGKKLRLYTMERLFTVQKESMQNKCYLCGLKLTDLLSVTPTHLTSSIAHCKLYSLARNTSANEVLSSLISSILH